MGFDWKYLGFLVKVRDGGNSETACCRSQGRILSRLDTVEVGVR